MIAPIVATTIELTSNGPSIGLVLNRTLARKPPTRAPTMPSTMCPMTPRPSSPLTRKPARYPAIAPRTIHAMMLIRNLHPSAGLSPACWGPLVYPEVRDIGAQCRLAAAPGMTTFHRPGVTTDYQRGHPLGIDLQSICDARTTRRARGSGWAATGCSSPESTGISRSRRTDIDARSNGVLGCPTRGRSNRRSPSTPTDRWTCCNTPRHSSRSLVAVLLAVLH